MLQLFTDTDCDITPEIAREYGYKLISMPYSYDGTTYYPYESYEKFDAKPFYDMLRAGTVPTTSAVGTEKYIAYFEPEFQAGNDILYVHFSKAMSMTFGPMQQAVDELLIKYPKRKFHTIDTKGITIISFNIVCEIGDMYKAGKSVEEMQEWAKTEVDKFALYFFADDLKFFRRSGRVSNLTGTVGTILGVRPIIYMNGEGKMVSIGKERGKSKAIDRLITYVEELGDDVKGHRVIIGHTDSPDIADEIETILRDKYGDDLRVIKFSVNPTAGSHCGPNGVGICFHSIHR